MIWLHDSLAKQEEPRILTQIFLRKQPSNGALRSNLADFQGRTPISSEYLIFTGELFDRE